jgi:hypothetical protein
MKWKWPVAVVAGVLAVYLVVRGIAELFVIHYSTPASYAGDWGGPSLAGVLAVHTGPALVIIAGTVWWLLRRRPGRYPGR